MRTVTNVTNIVPIIPPYIPTSLKALGADKIPIPTKALNELVNASTKVNFTEYF